MQLDQASALIGRLFTSVWNEDEEAIKDVLSPSCSCIMPDAGRSWKGTEKGIPILLRQVSMLKRQEGASFNAEAVEKVSETRFVVMERMRYSGKFLEVKAVYDIQDGRINCMSYVNVP